MKLKKVSNVIFSLLVLGILGLTQSNEAQAAFRIHTLGVVDYGIPRTGASVVGAGGGGSFEIGFGSAPVSIDLGGYYIQRGFTAGTPTVHLPAFLRFNFARDIISLGLGAAFDYQTNSRTFLYGPAFSLQFRIPMGRVVSFILDGRYIATFANISSGINSHYVQGLAGLSFRFGGGKM